VDKILNIMKGDTIMAPEPDLMDMVQLAVRETIKNELSLKANERHDGSIVIQLYLGKEPIGDPYYLNLTTTGDCEYITEVYLEVE